MPSAPRTDDPPGPPGEPEPQARPWRIQESDDWRQSDYGAARTARIQHCDLMFGILLAAVVLLLALSFC